MLLLVLGGASELDATLGVSRVSHAGSGPPVERGLGRSGSDQASAARVSQCSLLQNKLRNFSILLLCS